MILATPDPKFVKLLPRKQFFSSALPYTPILPLLIIFCGFFSHRHLGALWL